MCCCFEQTDDGHAVMVPVSETHPLPDVRHYVGAARIDGHDDAMVGGADGGSIQQFYEGFGQALLGTVMDGDCGIDVLCQMSGRPHTPDVRAGFREESHL